MLKVDRFEVLIFIEDPIIKGIVLFFLILMKMMMMQLFGLIHAVEQHGIIVEVMLEMGVGGGPRRGQLCMLLELLELGYPVDGDDGVSVGIAYDSAAIGSIQDVGVVFNNTDFLEGNFVAKFGRFILKQEIWHQRVRNRRQCIKVNVFIFKFQF